MGFVRCVVLMGLFIMTGVTSLAGLAFLVFHDGWFDIGMAAGSFLLAGVTVHVAIELAETTFSADAPEDADVD